MSSSQKCDAFFEHQINIDWPGRDGRLAGKVGECAHASLQAHNLIHHDLRCLLIELTARAILTRYNLFHRQPDRRKRVFHLVSHLSRQRLPAFQSREVDQPFLGLL